MTQKRHIEMSTRAKRKDIEIPEQCRIIREESPIVREVCDKVNKSKIKEKNPPTPFSTFETNFNLDFCTGKWRDMVLKWIEHKKAIKKPVMLQTSIEAFFSELQRESGNDPAFAEAIVNHTVSGGWGTPVVPDSIKKAVEQKKSINEKPAKQTIVW
jgi:hypothetical protein